MQGWKKTWRRAVTVPAIFAAFFCFFVLLENTEDGSHDLMAFFPGYLCFPSVSDFGWLFRPDEQSPFTRAACVRIGHSGEIIGSQCVPWGVSQSRLDVVRFVAGDAPRLEFELHMHSTAQCQTRTSAAGKKIEAGRREEEMLAPQW